MDYQCPSCNSKVLKLSEDKRQLTCESCEDVSMTLDEAKSSFEEGTLVAIMEEKEITDDDVIVSSIDEDIAALVEGENLSEAFQEKAKVIFESAVAARVKEQTAALEEAIETRVREDLSEKVDVYLDTVIGEWLEENKLAVEHGMKREMDERFMEGLAELFKEHYVEVPAGKEDLLEALAEKVEDLTARLDEAIEDNRAVSTELTEATKALTFKSITEGLADTQVEKLMELAEGIEASDAAEFGSKLEVLKESYIKDSTETVIEEDSKDTINEDSDEPLSAREKALALLKAEQ